VFDLVVTNRGMPILSGNATSPSEWLVLDEHGGREPFVFQTQRECVVRVRIAGGKLRAAPKALESEIVIESNGGRVSVPVRVEVPMRPFPTGVLAGALTPRDIVMRAKEHPRDVAQLFDQGAVEAWYRSNGWTYPIQTPATGMAAVQQFYEVLGLVKAPSLTIDTDRLQFTGTSGECFRGQVVVSTAEETPVYAHVESNQAWLTPARVKMSGNKATVRFDVMVPPQPGQTLEAQLAITANGNQRFVVPVNLTITGRAGSTSAVKPLMGLPAGASSSSAIPVAAPHAPPPAMSQPAMAPPPAPLVSSSGRRLTTLVRDAVDAAVSRAVPLGRGVSELSVLSLTLGLISLAITWPFTLAGVGIALGACGLAASGAALILVARRKGRNFGLPALAALVSTQALIMAIALAWNPPQAMVIVETPPAPRPNFIAIADVHEAINSSDVARKESAVKALGELAGQLETTRVNLLTALQDPEAPVRAAAATALGQIGPAARVTIPVLTHVARTDPNENVRRQADFALKKLPEPTNSDIVEFSAFLKDSHAGLRSTAARALGMIGPKARDAARDLEKFLGDTDAGVRVSAAEALWEILGPKAQGIRPVLVAGLEKGNPEVRARAAVVLGAIQDPKLVDVLEAALGDEDGGVRIQAAYALGKIGAPQTMPRFLKALGDREVKVKIVSAQAIWQIAKRTEGVPVLADALRDRDTDVRITAAAALGKFGRAARPAVPALSDALKDSNAEVRAYAAAALHHIGPEAKPAVGALLEALSNSDPTRRAHAAYALSGMGSEAREAAAALRKALDDPDGEVRLFAARAVWAGDPRIDEVLPVVTRVLNEQRHDPVLRSQAAAFLGSLGPPAHKAIPDLFEALHEEDPRIRASAAQACGEIGGPMARVAYPGLASLADRSEDAVRSAAAEALKKVGRPTRADVDTLVRALDDRRPRFRASAAVSLWFLNREAKKAVPALARALADEDDTVNRNVTFALAAIGPDAADAVPALRKMLGHPDDGRCGRAAYALGEMGPRANDAVPELQQLLNRTTEKLGVRFQAARALWAISRQSAELLPVLSLALGDEDPELNLQAVETLAKIAAELEDPKLKKPVAPEWKKQIEEQTIPNLKKLVQDSADTNLRIAAVSTLGALGLAARPAIPTLLAALDDKEADIRANAAEALGKIGAGETAVDKRAVWTKAAYRDLWFLSKIDQNERVQRAVKGALERIGALNSDDAAVCIALLQDRTQDLLLRHAAGQVLGMIGEVLGKDDVNRLGKMLGEDEDTAILTYAAVTLGSAGAAARAQSPALIRALKNDDPRLSAAAAEALGEIWRNQNDPAVRTALEAAAGAVDENVAAAAKIALGKMKR
jgi:HEAT repeat protein